MTKVYKRFVCLLVATASGAVSCGTADWPSFRGPYASGVAENQNLPLTWGGEAGEHIQWKKPVPGLAHASPVVWGDHLFLTTAVSQKPDPQLKLGLYGSGEAADDSNTHQWLVICLDKRTGALVWQQVAHEGVPRSKRHIKATQCNASPATDGRYLIAFFGSEGVFAYDLQGNLKWRKDVGVLDVGAYDAPTYEWGSASSPIIYKDLVIIQCDTQAEDFLMAIDIKTGETAWKSAREELPSWGTPTIYPGPGRPEVITNGSNFIRGYDPESGKELWWLGGSSQITAPTPVHGEGVIVVASGRRPEKPIFVLRPGAQGDVSLAEGQTANDAVVWHKTGEGPYMPTPLIYRGNLYTLTNQGIFFCYDLKTGEMRYKERVNHGGSGFSASPVAADGHLYLPSEDGEVFVVAAGNTYAMLARNEMGESIMASPALSEGLLFIRTRSSIIAVGQ